jgi:hypothetical protein
MNEDNQMTADMLEKRKLKNQMVWYGIIGFILGVCFCLCSTMTIGIISSNPDAKTTYTTPTLSNLDVALTDAWFAITMTQIAIPSATSISVQEASTIIASKFTQTATNTIPTIQKYNSLPIPTKIVSTDEPIIIISTIDPSQTSTPIPQPTIITLPTDNTNSCQQSGATAICNDGTCSYSTTHSGTCSHHGGVRIWIVDLASPEPTPTLEPTVTPEPTPIQPTAFQQHTP